MINIDYSHSLATNAAIYPLRRTLSINKVEMIWKLFDIGASPQVVNAMVM